MHIETKRHTLDVKCSVPTRYRYASVESTSVVEAMCYLMTYHHGNATVVQ